MHEINVWPRKSGKSFEICKMSNKEDLIIVKNIEHKKYINIIRSSFNKRPCYIYTIQDLADKSMLFYQTFKYPIVFIDDFLLFSEKERESIIGFLIKTNLINTSKIRIFTTSDRLYSRPIINILRNTPNGYKSEIMPYLTDDGINEVFKNRFTLLDDTRFEIKFKVDADELRNQMSEDLYKTEVEGKLFRED